MLRDWLRGAFRSGLAAAGLALFVASPLFGQASTGKIQGRVTDAATGERVQELCEAAGAFSGEPAERLDVSEVKANAHEITRALYTRYP